MSIWFGYMAVPDGAVVADGRFEDFEAAQKARTLRMRRDDRNMLTNAIAGETHYE